jgi:hypothetical protein
MPYEVQKKAPKVSDVKKLQAILQFWLLFNMHIRMYEFFAIQNANGKRLLKLYQMSNMM